MSVAIDKFKYKLIFFHVSHINFLNQIFVVIDLLIIYCFTSTQEFFHFYRVVTIVGEGLERPMLAAQGL
jgi:hypothetical protein